MTFQDVLLQINTGAAGITPLTGSAAGLGGGK